MNDQQQTPDFKPRAPETKPVQSEAPTVNLEIARPRLPRRIKYPPLDTGDNSQSMMFGSD